MKKSFPRKVKKNETGQSLVETALTLPIFLLVLCGILDFGWLFTNQLMLNNCSREAARIGVVSADQADKENIVKAKAESMLFIGVPEEDFADVQFFDEDVTVTVNLTVPCLTPIVGAFYTNNQAELTSTTVMRIG
jgi:Flp pilus assembly protein TadG